MNTIIYRDFQISISISLSICKKISIRAVGTGWGEGMGGASPPTIFWSEKFLFLLKMGVDEREGVDGKKR